MSMGQATVGGKRPMHVLPLAKRAEVIEHLEVLGHGERGGLLACTTSPNMTSSIDGYQLT
jgi:hypothetical protein